jgi:hypothetical protein
MSARGVKPALAWAAPLPPPEPSSRPPRNWTVSAMMSTAWR